MIIFDSGTYFASMGWSRAPQSKEQLFMHKERGHIVETAVEARAGFLGRPTLVVLLVSTGVTIGLFAIIYIGVFAH